MLEATDVKIPDLPLNFTKNVKITASNYLSNSESFAIQKLKTFFPAQARNVPQKHTIHILFVLINLSNQKKTIKENKNKNFV